MADGRVTIDTRLDTSGLKQGVKQVPQAMQKMTKSVLKLASAVAVAFSVKAIYSFSKEASKLYDNQIEQETKLATIIKQRMDATDEQIAQVKKLASEQQALGVIGDEVQLAGVQQVATFLKSTDAIEKLLPAMNNLLAQQKGLNATESDAVSIGNLMGKALQGQTDALKRVGISFTDAEANVIKYGNEMERAEMLAKVITNNVGEMNKALAQTDAGKQKQLANTIGDLKEEFGSAVSTLKNTVLPVLARMVRVFSNLTSNIKVFSNTVKKVFGTNEANSINNATSNTQGLADATEDVVDAQKELLGGYDDLNVISKDTTSDSTDSVDDVSSLISAMDSVDSAIDNTSKKLEEFFGYFKSGNYEAIGKSIGTNLKNTLNNIKWKDIYKKAENFGKGLAEFLNGLFDDSTFSAVASTIAGLLNTAIYKSLGFMKSFDFGKFGEEVAKAINTFFRDFDFKALTRGINAFLNGIVDAVAGFLSKISFKGIVSAIGDILKTLDWGTVIQVMSTIIAVKWIAKAITSGASAIASTFSSGIASVFSTGLTGASLGIASAIAIPIVAGMGLAIKQAQNEAQYWEDYRQWLVDISMPTEEWQARIDELADKTKALVDESNARIQKLGDINVDYTAIQNMADEYFNLAEKQGKSDEELNKMKMLHDTLIKEYPEFESILDDEKKTYDDQKKSIQDLIVEMQNKAKQKAIEDMLVETYKQQYEAEKNLEKAQDDYNEAYSEYEKNRAGYKDARAKYLEYVEQAKRGELEYTDLMRDAKKEMDNQYEAYSRSASAVLGLKGNVDDASDVLNQINGEIDDYTKAFSKSMDTTQKETKETVEETKKSLPDITSGFGDVVEKFKTFGGNILDGLKNGLSNSTKISGITGAITNVTSLVTGLFKKKTEIGSPSKLFNQYGQWIDEGLAIGLDKGTSDVKNAMGNVSGIVAGLSTPAFAGGSKIPTNSTFSSIISTGLNASTSSLVKALSSLANNDSEIVIQIDGKNVFNAVRNQNNAYKKMTGATAF